VVTTKGRSLILFPISRAIQAAERFDGMRIHRSHWVAFRHVTALSKDDSGLFACLSSGEKLPVSRSSQQAVRAALDADALRRLSSQFEAGKAKAAL
jgi:DNA-binding LytR/AlgR family response regulator